jgi:hypothetical protein
MAMRRLMAKRLYRSECPRKQARVGRHVLATILRQSAMHGTRCRRSGRIQCSHGRGPSDPQPGLLEGVTAMQSVELRIEGRASGVIATRVWRELGQLALEGMAIGLAFSILLAAAVYMVARNAHDDAYYSAHDSPAAQVVDTAAA